MTDASRPELRSESLRRSWTELESAGEEAEALAADLTSAQLWWRPAAERWSVGECLDHLVRTGEAYLEVLDDSIEEARLRGVRAAGPYRRSLVGRLLARVLEPPPRLKIGAPRMIRPRRPGASDRAAPQGERRPGDEGEDRDPLARFLALRSRLGERLEAADGLDLGRVRVTSPFFSWIRFDLGSAFRVVAAHERRHLWQARKVREEDDFPRA